MTTATMTIRRFLSLCVISNALVPKQTLDVTFKGCKFANLSLYAGTGPEGRSISVYGGRADMPLKPGRFRCLCRWERSPGR